MMILTMFGITCTVGIAAGAKVSMREIGKLQFCAKEQFAQNIAFATFKFQKICKCGIQSLCNVGNDDLNYV